MTTDTRTAERTAERIAAGTVQLRTERDRRRAASKARTAARTAERTAATSRGWGMLTAANVADMTAAGIAVGRQYLGTDAAELSALALDRVSAWLGSPPYDRNGEPWTAARTALHAERIVRVRRSRGASGYAARTARRAATQLVRRRGTGRGSMPRLVISDAEIDARLDAIYGVRSRSVAVGTVDAAAVHRGELDAVEVGDRIAGIYMHAAYMDAGTAYRHITDAELDAIRRTAVHERTAAAPNYSAWLDAYGDGVPMASAGHTMGHIAPGVPERDAAQLRRGSLADRMDAAGIAAGTVDAAVHAMDAVSTRRISAAGHIGRYPVRVPWTVIADRIDAAVIPATLARRVDKALSELADAESINGYVYAAAMDARGHYWRTVAQGTGRRADRRGASYDGVPVVYSTSPGRRYTPAMADRDAALIANGNGEPWNRWTSYMHARQWGPGYQRTGDMALAAFRMYAERTGIA